MAKTYRVNAFVRISNALVAFLLRMGVKMGTMPLLSVRGRTSGKIRTTPVALVELDGDRLLIAPFGSVNWVRNLRAAGEAMLTRGRHNERVSAIELSIQESGPILKKTLVGAPSFVTNYFDVTPDSPLADFEREAPRHPVFRLNTLF
jgi:deazaflavin-dependent oxidoreductase (nitroreductase family)